MPSDDISLSPDELFSLAEEVRRDWPHAKLKKNGMGNLVIEIDGEYVGFIDFYGPEVVIFSRSEL